MRFGRGDGSFGQSASYAAASILQSLAVGDFNADGVPDIAVTVSDFDDTVNVLLNRAKEGVAPLLPFSLKSRADALQVLPLFSRKRDQLAAQRGGIGAFQSRVSTALNAIESARENFVAAASRITDADMAKESADLVRTQILQRATTVVLAQANQQPALALKLLRTE